MENSLAGGGDEKCIDYRGEVTRSIGRDDNVDGGDNNQIKAKDWRLIRV